MPSTLHEMLVELFVVRPDLAAEMLDDVLGVELPQFDATAVTATDATELSPTEYRADAVITLTDAGTAVLAVVVEPQLHRDSVKRWTWPVYVATLRARMRCPAVLLVVCVNEAVAAWCAEPIGLGNPGSFLLPVVLGPEQVPLILDAAQADRSPELAMLSAMAHGADRSEALDVLPAAFASLEDDRAKLYLDIVLDGLPAAARQHLEDLMAAGTYEYKSDFARKYYGQGQAEALLGVLDARGIAVPEEDRARIAVSTDLKQLAIWLRRAVTVESIDELFAAQA